eukprot:TRINITY_DN2262_c0_g1_i1.p1 TRINITY_DN2262_c0_g1~~TRINITY_DN2262_c0_g1_i1.p1  ORF type:complete len:319 (+),score=98.40 TRINITY_DN2262_c0_g1_i1:61-957(+)
MRTASLLLAAGALPVSSLNVTVDLVDTARGSRRVQAVMCLPDSSEPSTLYVFAHGFDCFGPDYLWLCGMPGVAVASVVSSGIPYLPDTADLARDQAFLSRALPDQSRNESSPLYGRLSGEVAIGGHSMGGGTTFLAADPAFANASFSAAAVLAPGMYTIPSAWPHSPADAKPTLILSGARDCGPNQVEKTQNYVFGNVSAAEKALVVVAGGDHCGWTASTKGVCKGVEKSGCPTITREQQHALGVELVAPFLSATTGGAGWAGFEALLMKGEKEGRWTYTSHLTPAKTVSSACPCPAL